MTGEKRTKSRPASVTLSVIGRNHDNLCPARDSGGGIGARLLPLAGGCSRDAGTTRWRPVMMRAHHPDHSSAVGPHRGAQCVGECVVAFGSGMGAYRVLAHELVEVVGQSRGKRCGEADGADRRAGLG